MLCCIPGVCLFQEQPEEVYGIMGEPLYIPCVTDTDYDIVMWFKISGSSIGDSIYGIYSTYRHHYEVETGQTPRKNFTLKIKSVNLDEPQLRCDVEVPGSPPKLVRSSWSAITVVGKLWYH